AWAPLDTSDVFRLYGELITELRGAGFHAVVATARKADFPSFIPPQAMVHVDPKSNLPPVMTNTIHFGDKQLAVWCAQGAMIPLSRKPGLDKVRFWPDPDTTSIEWIDKKRRASTAIGGFIDLGPALEPAE